jgi:hypothetical protein
MLSADTKLDCRWSLASNELETARRLTPAARQPITRQPMMSQAQVEGQQQSPHGA